MPSSALLGVAQDGVEGAAEDPGLLGRVGDDGGALEGRASCAPRASSAASMATPRARAAAINGRAGPRASGGVASGGRSSSGVATRIRSSGLGANRSGGGGRNGFAARPSYL